MLRLTVRVLCVFFFFKQKTAYEMRISDWSSDVCSSDLLATAILEDFDIFVGEPLNGMTATQGPADRIEFWGFEFIHAVVGRPAERIGNRHSRCCYSDEAGGIDNGFSSALTPRSTSRTMALCLISRSVGGVIILGVKGDGDVRDFSPGSTSFYPVHREGGELIDFGFSGCQHQTAKIREVRHRIGRCPQPLP